MKSISTLCVGRLVVLCFLLIGSQMSNVIAGSISLTPSKDNTLFEFDPTDTNSLFNSNGAGDFLSAWRNRSRALIRRGLLRFDFSELPFDAVVRPGTLQLTLEVVSAPRRDTSGEPRGFWLLPIEQD